ncbi:MAG: glycoside hydrolase family 3 C-terminal domain-containing protein [Oscillospiraceae bacterium]|jgi:beta-glucosidase|nr:glycoside hydrolase family 3 C-terminal domain-containing protein [Oscillospiraceae bacterium]
MKQSVRKCIALAISLVLVIAMVPVVPVMAADELLTDVKTDPDFIAWKANHFQGDVPQSVDDIITAVVGRMSIAQRVQLLEGVNTLGGILPGSGRLPGSAGATRAFAAFGIPMTTMSDGPAGLRLTVSSSGTERNATFWPNGSARAAAWNRALTEEMGTAWGKEQYYFGNDIILAPGMNIHRSVLNGRNFEYYSEDPYLSGYTAAAEIRGIQSQDVGVTIKHYAMNNQETSRYNLPTVVGTRALREIYLRNFQYAIEDAQPWAVMDSYNQVNGVSTAQSYALNTTILRNEWGFKGFVMTDWLGGLAGSSAGNAADIYPGWNNDRPISSNHGSRVKSGNELAQWAGSQAQVTSALNDASHPLTQDDVDLACKRILQYVVKTPVFNDQPISSGATDPDMKAENRALGQDIGTEGVVLLKNDSLANGKPALPLDPGASGKVLSLGNAADKLIAGGLGSGSVNMSAADAAAIPTLNAAMAEIIGANLINTAALGFSQTASILEVKSSIANLTGTTIEARSEMVIPPSQFDAWAAEDVGALTFVIQRGSAEGADVPTEKGAYYISDAESNIINQASAFARAKGIPFIVVLNMGTWIKVSDWEDKADAVLMMWEQGMAGGRPPARVLFGLESPSGKTPTSVPVDIVGSAPNGQKYNPTEGRFGSSSGSTYNEGIFVGYRYYDTYNVPVAYPFGHGLSYTTFDYVGAALDKAVFADKDDTLTAGVTVTNAGGTAGKEVVQFYIGAPGLSMKKPVKELKGYEKTGTLAPGGSEVIRAEFDAMSLASYDPDTGNWVVEPGHYAVYFAASSQDIREVRSFEVPEEIVVTTVDKNAAAPRVAVDEFDPNSVTVTFAPPRGAAFQRAYALYGGAYNYLPALPAGYRWVDAGTGAAVEVSDVVTAGDKTFEARRNPIEIVLDGGEATASVIYGNDASQPANPMLLIGLFDEKDRLLDVGADIQPGVAGMADATDAAVSLRVSLPVTEETALVRAFLWDGDSYEVLLDSISRAVDWPRADA